MQAIKNTTTTTTTTTIITSCSVLAMLAGACDDEREGSGRDITLYQTSADGASIQLAASSVSIQRMDADGLHWCSGVIVADSWILTAAHCVEDKPAASLQVEAGLGDTAAEPLLRGVERVVMHPGFVPQRLTHADDLALLRLATPLDLSVAGVAAVELGAAAELEPTSAGVMGRVNGRGSSDEDSDALQVVSVELIPNADARAIYRTPIGLEQLASKPLEGPTCQADGGSALMIDTLNGPRLVGVASEGAGCDDPSSLQIYTRVSSYLEWIDGEIRSVP